MNEGQKVSKILDKKVFDRGTLVQPHFANMLINPPQNFVGYY